MSTSGVRNGEVALFPDLLEEAGAHRTSGILPSQAIRDMIARGCIVGNTAITEDQVQPASLDLRLGDIAHPVRASFLAGPNSTVDTKINQLRMTRVDLTSASVFGKDCVYIVPRLEDFHFPDNISGRANP